MSTACLEQIKTTAYNSYNIWNSKLDIQVLCCVHPDGFSQHADYLIIHCKLRPCLFLFPTWVRIYGTRWHSSLWIDKIYAIFACLSFGFINHLRKSPEQPVRHWGNYVYIFHIKRDAWNPILNKFSKATSSIFSACKRLTGIWLQSSLSIICS